ncbi:Cytochrome P450 protein [Rutstroemia sp. NJR-2017a BBW]|nr:Cytochrome P450 protein [Rutstroemia sp. NJR-2017a BBW]
MDTHFNITSSFLKVAGGLIIIFSLYILSHITYNVFFHPLRSYPGPKLWAATRLPWCYNQYQGQLHYRLLQLHNKYGHTVRVAPNELSYNSDDAWKSIYGHRKEEMSKDPIFRLHTPTGAQNILVADRETHTRQRRLLSHAFSESALREQEPILQHYSRKLLDQLSRECNKGPLDMVSWLTFASFDLIGHMSFGENFGCLDKGDYVPFVRAITAMASELTLNQMCKYYKIMGIRQFFTPASVMGQRKKHIGTAMQTVQRRIAAGSEHRDFLHYILSANNEKGMSPAEINVNAFSLSIAGSESTATALSGAFFLMLTHAPVYRRLVEEIRSAHMNEDDITLSSIHKLEYLDAVITETLRLYPPVAITLPRCVPSGGETISGSFVPEGTTVGVHHYSTYHSPSNFHLADEFHPERWLRESRDLPPFAGDNKECMQPFSYGPRNCLGKNIARAEMRLLLAKLIWRFDWEMEAGQEGWMAGQKVQGFWQKGALMCRLRLVVRQKY